MRQPYIPLYIGDWEQDTNCLSIEAEGATLKIVFKCWKNNGVFMTNRESTARLWKVDQIKFAAILLELKNNNIFDIEERPDGAMLFVSRRVKRDIDISAKRAESGSKGGSKTQANTQANSKQIPDIDNEIDTDTDIKIIKEPEIEFWPTFNDFWDLYDKKVDRTKCEKVWGKLSREEREAIMLHIPEYRQAQPDKKFRKDPYSYLYNKSYENEIIKAGTAVKRTLSLAESNNELAEIFRQRSINSQGAT